MIRRVHDEQRAIRQYLLDEACVREAVVQAPIAVAVVGIVEEDQVAGRSELGAVHASVTLDPADDGPHTVVARPAFGEEIDIGALVQGVEISRAVRGHRIPVEPRAADPESVARGGEDNFDGIGRRRATPISRAGHRGEGDRREIGSCHATTRATQRQNDGGSESESRAAMAVEQR